MRRSSLLFLIVLVWLSAAPAADAATRRGSGQVRFRDENALSDKVTVLLFGATPPAVGTHYQGWLGNDAGTAWIDIGTLALNEKGDSTVEWVSPSGENVLASYTQFVITSDPDGRQISWPYEARVVYRGAMPAEARAVVQALTVLGPDTPQPTRAGLALGLKEEAKSLANEARDARQAMQDAQRSRARGLDEALLNRIVGINDGAWGDWDGDGTVKNSSDTYGLARYAQAVQGLARPLATNPNLPENVVDRANRIVAATSNILDFTSQIRNLTTVIGPNVNIDDATVVQHDIEWLARSVVEGVDRNGDGIQSEQGEGGARSVYTSAQDLGRIYFRAVE